MKKNQEKEIPYYEQFGDIEHQREEIIQFVKQCDNIKSISMISWIINMSKAVK